MSASGPPDILTPEVLRHLLDASPVATHIEDGLGRIIHVNAAWTALFGHSPQEASGLTFSALLAPGGGPVPGEREVEVRRKDGSRLHVAAFAADVPLSGGGLLRQRMFIGVCGRRASLRALSSLFGLLDENEAAIRDFALEEGVRMTGSTYGLIMNLSHGHEDEALVSMSGAAARDCGLASPDPERMTVLGPFWRGMAGRLTPHIDNSFRGEGGSGRMPDGHVVLNRLLSVPFLDEGRVVLVAAVSGKVAPYDETDVRHLTLLLDAMWRLLRRKRLERDALIGRITAEEASRCKSDFLANMSHEIRTPISSIMGMVEMIMATRPRPEHCAHLDMIKNAARSLLGIVNDILDLSKVEAGKLDLHPVDFNLPRSVRMIVDSFAGQAQAKGLTLQLRLAADVAEEAHGDMDRLAQVLRNLIVNALKFTERGLIEVAVARAEPGDDPLHVRLSVRDTGIGITPEKMATLFEPVSRFECGPSGEGGSGLGLAISRLLSGLWGGRIWAESVPGQGSVFHFTVRLKPSLERREVRPERAAPEGADRTRSLHILLAEDNEVNRIFLSHFLGEAGHTVRSVEDGAKVVEMCATGEFDLVLMDVQMPGVDGVEATRRIRRLESLDGDRRVPIIALTAYAMTGDRERFLEAGMDAYVSKPVDMNELLREVRRVAGGAADNPRLVDLRELEGRFQGRERLFAEMAGLFRDNASRRMTEMTAALQAGDLPAAGKAAHGLIGSCVAVRSKPAVDAARELSNRARSNDLPGAQKAFQVLRSMIQGILDILSERGV